MQIMVDKYIHLPAFLGRDMGENRTYFVFKYDGI